jgi:predicted phage baseplate assembly protein
VIELRGVAGFDGEDLRSGRAVPLLGVGGPAEARIGIALAEPPPRRAALPVSILFELDTAVRPEWDPEAVPASPPAALRWEYQDTEGAWRPLAELHDGTRGLRRSGLVRFALPRRWSAYGDEHIGWLRVATGASTFSSPPAVLRVAPNSAIATHAVWRTHREAPGWLPLPGRAVQLPAAPLPLADSMYVSIDEPEGRRRWHVVPDLVGAAPADRVAVLDRGRARVVFGDGLTGRVPRLARQEGPQVMVHYAAGGGAAGNVAPCAWETVGGVLAGARSLVAAVGGRDPETLDEARARAAASLQRPERAVTPHDHEVLACTTPGIAIARAHAEVGLSRGECGLVPGVTTVFVVPGSTARTRDAVRDGSAVAAPIADPGALAEVRRRLERARLLGEVVVVEPAVYRRVCVRVSVAAAPHEGGGLRRRLEAALRMYLDPLLGGDEQTGWPFGQPVRPTALLGVAQRELGDRGDVTAVAVAIDGGEPVTCQDVAIRGHELIAVEAIEVAISVAGGAKAGLR